MLQTCWMPFNWWLFSGLNLCNVQSGLLAAAAITASVEDEMDAMLVLNADTLSLSVVDYVISNECRNVHVAACLREETPTQSVKLQVNRYTCFCFALVLWHALACGNIPDYVLNVDLIRVSDGTHVTTETRFRTTLWKSEKSVACVCVTCSLHKYSRITNAIANSERSGKKSTKFTPAISILNSFVNHLGMSPWAVLKIPLMTVFRLDENSGRKNRLTKFFIFAKLRLWCANKWKHFRSAFFSSTWKTAAAQKLICSTYFCYCVNQSFDVWK